MPVVGPRAYSFTHQGAMNIPAQQINILGVDAVLKVS